MGSLVPGCSGSSLATIGTGLFILERSTSSFRPLLPALLMNFSSLCRKSQRKEQAICAKVEGFHYGSMSEEVLDIHCCELLVNDVITFFLNQRNVKPVCKKYKALNYSTFLLFLYLAASKGTCHLRFSGFCPLR